MPYNLNVKGHMYKEELQLIEKLASTKGPNSTIVEVGTFCGRSAIAWALSSDPSTNVLCFDPFWEHLDFEGEPCNTWEEFQENTKDIKNIRACRGLVDKDIWYTEPNKIDIFFIDATHENPVDWDIIYYFLPFIKSGGIVAGHDYTPYGSGKTANSIAWPDVNFNVHRLEEMFDQKAKTYLAMWHLIKP